MKKRSILTSGLIGAALLAVGVAAIMLTSHTGRTVCPTPNDTQHSMAAFSFADAFEHRPPISFSDLPKQFSHTHCCDSLPDPQHCPDFALRLPQYKASTHPFLSSIEEFYNSCALLWTVWNEFEAWFTQFWDDSFGLDSALILHRIRSAPTDIIRNAEVRRAAQVYKDSIMLILQKDEWDNERDNPRALRDNFVAAIERETYCWYEDKDLFSAQYDSMLTVQKALSHERYQRYLKANEDNQQATLLRELSACQDFDEQCSLWWQCAARTQPAPDNEFLVITGLRLLESGLYSPLLHLMWITWRAHAQLLHGASYYATLPNHYFNLYRRQCLLVCLRRIESNPDDIYALNCASVLAGNSNICAIGSEHYNSSIPDLLEMKNTVEGK